MTFEEWWKRRENSLANMSGIASAKAAWQAAQPQWQPIDSAPKDESEIILCDESVGESYSGYFEITPNYWGEIGFQISTYRYAGYRENRIRHPTHWMPLPEPPNV